MMTTATISMTIFSGRTNPRWVIPEADRTLAEILSIPVVSELSDRANIDGKDPPRPLAGFRGFDIMFGGSDSHQFRTWGRLITDVRTGQLRRDLSDLPVEARIYATAPPAVVAVLASATYAALTFQGDKTPISGLIGPDHHLACESSPAYRGNTGRWKQYQLNNNCYNYGTDTLSTVIEAIPGRGQGLMNHALTPARLRAALRSDKLELVGMKLPTRCSPAGTHLVAAVLRRHPTLQIRDFHFIRLDRSGRWSHKDGPGCVRNIDDDRHPIRDLTTARFLWNPKLLGIYRAYYSKRRLID